MAEKRMISQKIVDSDLFLDMPLSTQALYLHLLVRADDDGFIDNPRRIRRMIGASDDDVRILIAKSFVLPFESGVIVIKHWRVHNCIKSDRYHETVYQNEKKLLVNTPNGYEVLEGEAVEPKRIQSGTILEPTWNQNGSKVEPEIRLDKNRLDKSSDIDIDDEKKRKRFVPPTVEEVREYCREKGYDEIDPQRFVDFYEAKGWMIGKNKIVNWKSCVNTWRRGGKSSGSGSGSNGNSEENGRGAAYRDIDDGAL